MTKLFIRDWERCLEAWLLGHSGRSERAYVCSPLCADTAGCIMLNMKGARAYMYYISQVFGCSPRAPHAYLPLVLDDQKEGERKHALKLGLLMLDKCDCVYVCGDRVSEGMAGEIARAVSRKIPVYTFTEAAYSRARAIAKRGGDTGGITWVRGHPFLELSPSRAYMAACDCAQAVTAR